jgi:hypothetical protein
MQEYQIDQSISTSYAKGKSYFDRMLKAGKVADCSPGYVSGSCFGGHRFAAVQYCGREYCKDCGLDGSPIHQRRVNNWMERIKDWQQVGYLVVTVPEAVRPYFHDKLVLKDFRSKLLRKLKEDYQVSKGIARWHWFGDCTNCCGRGCKLCNDTGSAENYNPHLNILLPSGFIEDVFTYFEGLRKWIAQYFVKLINIQIEINKKYCHLGFDDAFELLDYHLEVKRTLIPASIVVNYSYVSTDAMKMNRVKYITRSTFRRFAEDTKAVLYNFRNCVVWGWKKDGIQEQDDTALTVNCPVCERNGIQHKIHWHRISKFKTTNIIKHYGNEKSDRPIIRIRDRDNNINDRDTSYVPVTFAKPTGKISWNRINS